MNRQTVDLGYRCRPQFAPFHQRKQRWATVVAHRRAGKTVACVMDLVDDALRCKLPNPRFAYLAPFYAQAKDVAWTYLKQFTAPIPGAQPNESELRVDLPNGARVRLYGADNYNRMRGIYLDGVVLDEYADMDPRAWSEVLRPALADRQGKAVFIGTPKGRNSFWDRWQIAQTDPEWYALMLKASETGLVAAKELEQAKKEMTPEQYDQEFECSFLAAIVGAYYGREMASVETAKRITSVSWDPSIPVHTAWDLGVGDSTAIWFCQRVGREWRFIDFIENHGVGLDWYAKELKSRPYVYGEHLLPHDAEVREMTTAVTRTEFLRRLGIQGRVLKAQRLEDGINAARNLLPSCWFDAEKCERGIEALRQYRREFDEQRKVFKNAPLHDWTSHAADAFRYMAIGEPRAVDQDWQKPLNQPMKGVV